MILQTEGGIALNEIEKSFKVPPFLMKGALEVERGRLYENSGFLSLRIPWDHS
jgi:hypothetical protein